MPDFGLLMLAALIVFVYFTTILILGRLLGQSDRISYLTAAGSAICGASAINDDSTKTRM